MMMEYSALKELEKRPLGYIGISDYPYSVEVWGGENKEDIFFMRQQLEFEREEFLRLGKIKIKIRKFINYVSRFYKR